MLITNHISGEPHARGEDPIVIGLVNNMPDAALRTTERQFHDLLAAASGSFAATLRLFALPGLPRGPEARSHVNQFYESIGELRASPPDGLIVTGAEPRADALPDEPYWPALTQLADWAEDRGMPTVWSCLAAHAAVLHADGIERWPLSEKLSGVFDCAKAADHLIVAGAPFRWRTPHSRHNDLLEEALIANGYQILSRSSEAGADMFIKERSCLSIFLQGHPEYDAGALFREYRRDVRRFLIGERDVYPEMPRGYFDAGAAAAFAAFRERAMRNRRADLMLAFPKVEDLACSWREPAVRLYSNWLSYLAERKRGCGVMKVVREPALAPRLKQAG